MAPTSAGRLPCDRSSQATPDSQATRSFAVSQRSARRARGEAFQPVARPWRADDGGQAFHGEMLPKGLFALVMPISGAIRSG